MMQVPVGTFNVNQFSKPEHQRADLLDRMESSDIVEVQECVDLDLDAFVADPATIKAVGKWHAHQVRTGTDDGHANTAVLWRADLGNATRRVLIPVGDAPDTRARFLAAILLDGCWYGSLHIFPARDQRYVAHQLAAAGGWVKGQHAPVHLGLDKNQAAPAALEAATGLTWHGIGIDGFLTNLPVTGLMAFPKGYSDHPGVHGIVTVGRRHNDHHHSGGHVSYQPPSPPYLGPAAHTSPGDNKPISRIVIHSTVSPCKPGGARQIAGYFRSSAAGGSAHYVVDPSEVVQVVYDGVIAWHAPPNAHSLGIEMCDTPGPVPNDKPGTARYKAAKRAWRWLVPAQMQMLNRTAELTAQLCAAYDVPPRFIGPDRLRRGEKGVTTHNNVSQTWHQSTHWDPGFWPRRHFMRLVRKHYAQITKEKP